MNTTQKLLLSATTFFLVPSMLCFASPRDFNVAGRVCNAQGEALTGVRVALMGTTTHTLTDQDGRFAFSDVPSDGRLLFSYLGYETQEVTATDSLTVSLIEKNEDLGEAVVTTQKRHQIAIEVPVAVSALSGTSLENMQIKGMEEMAEFIPGLEVQVQSPNNPGYVIRGVTSDGGESYSAPRISVFTDGVSTTRSRASVAELFDMERVEVVKGPQGTLFGRGAEIGAIHLIRNRAKTDRFEGEIAVNGGTRGQRGAEGMVNTPFSNRVANRFAFSYDAHNGYIKNTEGGSLNGKSSLALRNSTRFLFGNHTAMDLVLDYQYDDAPGTSFKTQRIAAIGGDISPYSTASLNGGKDLGITRHVGGATLLLNHELSSSWKLSSITGFRAFKSNERFDADGSYLPLLDCEENVRGTQFSQELRLGYDATQRFSGFIGLSYFYENSRQQSVVRSNLSYLFPAYIGQTFNNTISPVVTPAISALSSSIDGLIAQVGGMIGTEAATQLLSPLKTSLEALPGKWFPSSYDIETPVTATQNFYGDIESVFQNFIADAASNPMLALYLSSMGLTSESSLTDILSKLGASETQLAQFTVLKNYSNVALGEQAEEATNYGINQAVEIFADGSWKIYRGLTLTAGLRGSYEHQKTGYSSTTVENAILGHIQFAPTNGQKVWMSDDYFSWVGRVALNYMFGKNNAYISISRGRRPAVLYFNNTPEKEVHLKPEVIVSYEAGLKGSLFDGRLGYELAAYYYDWSHFQTSRLDPDQATSSLVRNYIADDAGKAHSFGVEIGARYRLMRSLSVFGNYAYIDGKFNDTDGNGNEQEYAGNSFRLTPKHTFAIGADAIFPLAHRADIYVRPSYTWKSAVFFEDDNDPALRQGAYGLLNCTAGVRFSTAKVGYDISLYGKNMLNEKYLIDAGNTGNAIGFPTYIAGSPSRFGVQVKLSF